MHNTHTHTQTPTHTYINTYNMHIMLYAYTLHINDTSFVYYTCTSFTYIYKCLVRLRYFFV